MRVEVEVRLRTALAGAEVWATAGDPTAWPPMPGADLVYEVLESESPSRLRYSIVSGLPVRDHEGLLLLEPTAGGGTEIVLHESFRGRLWGTTGYLRGRRERALVDLARTWCGPTGS